MTKFTTRTLKVIVMPEGDPIYSERSTTIEIDDLAAGEFIVIRQNFGDDKEHKLCFDREDWSAVKVAVDEIFKTLRIENELRL
jgi:hypothetical protein